MIADIELLASNDTDSIDANSDIENQDSEEEENEELDPLLLESGRVLADFINLIGGGLSAR
jgi:hypothetical protein